jgi:hypothetical protein
MFLTLSELKHYMRSHIKVTQQQISQHFGVDRSLVIDRMRYFINKGQVQEEQLMASCGSGCGSCSNNCTIVYRWNIVVKDISACQYSL